MTNKTPYERALDKSETITRIKMVTRDQINGTVDSVRARAMLESYLNHCLDSGCNGEHLAEAITRGISEAAFEMGITRSY